MYVRRFLASTVCAVLVAGCSQGTAVMPSAGGQNATQSGAHAASVPNPLPTIKLRFFPTPTSLSWPDYITQGSDGNVWFTEFYADQVGRITPSGTITEFPLPALNDIEGIAAGPDGDLWFTEPGENKIGRMTTTGVVAVFPINAADPSPRGIAAGPDGNVWFVEYYGDAIGRITPSGRITQFKIPQGQSYPWWIAKGADGDLWFTESSGDLIGRFNPSTLKFDAPVRVPGQSVVPWGIMSAPDGRIWFTERTAGDIAVVLGNRVKAFHIADKTSYPDTMVTGPDGDIWFTENQADAVGRFDPATGTFLPVIRLPGGDIPTGITVGADGNIWFTVANYYEQNSIGEIVLR